MSASSPASEIVVVNTALQRRFRVRLLRRGERYGLDRKLTHEREAPLVEFYDLDAGSDERGFRADFGGEGQFVSRYYAKTLLEDGERLRQHGLWLDAGVPVWQLSAANMDEVLRWLQAHAEARRRVQLLPRTLGQLLRD